MEVLYTPDNGDIYIQLDSQEISQLQKIGDTISGILVANFSTSKILKNIIIETVFCKDTPRGGADCLWSIDHTPQLPRKILISQELLQTLTEKKQEMIRMGNELLDFKIDDYMRKQYITTLSNST